jgi:hypothetical protein
VGAAARRPERAWPAPLFALDPLVWCHRWGRAGGLERLAGGELLLALSAATLVLLAVLSLRARPAGEGA